MLPGGLMRLSPLFALVVLAGCGVPEPGELYASKLSRIRTPQVSEEDSRALSAGHQDFAFALYHQLPGDAANRVVSPYSVSKMMAQLWAGARNETEQQIATAMRFSLEQSRFHPAFDKLDLQLEQMGQGARGANGGPFQFRSVDAAFVQRGMYIDSAYLDTLAQHYGTAVRGMDFIAEPEDARVKINDWVEGMTEGKIRDLLAPGTITPDVRLAVVDAVYLSAAWLNTFETSKTHPRTFHRLDETSVQVQMMTREAKYQVGEGDGYTAVGLPYDADGLSFLLVLPDQGRFTEVEQRLDRAFLDEVVAGLSEHEIVVGLPRFSARQEVDLKPILQSFGMGAAFTEAADFSGINGDTDLLLLEVGQQATIDVNESGTVAAAAAWGLGGVTSAPTSVVVDRPFLFLIREASTGAILFLGRIEDPTAG